MIHALHGAVGMAEDWSGFPVHGIDLWELLEGRPISLEAAGQKIAEAASDGDTLLGYSMGGRLALHAMAYRRWKKVILVSTHPGLIADHEERLRQDEQWAQKAEGDWDQFLTEWNAQTILPPVSWGEREKLRSRKYEISQSFRSWSLGSQKRFTPDSGHRVPWENPEAFRAVLSQLVAK